MSVLTGILILFPTLFVVVIAYFKWIFSYWKRRGVETAPPTIPFGNASDVFRRKTSFGLQFRKTYEEFKPKGLRYCGYYFLAKPSLFVIDPDLIRLMLTKDHNHFADHATYSNEKIDPLTAHLFNLKGLKWRNLRAKLTPTFTSGKMKMMFQTLVNCSDELIVEMDKILERKEPVEIKDIVARFTTDIIGSCAFGLECNSLRDPNSEFRDYGKRVFQFERAQAFKNLLSLAFPALLDFFEIPLLRRDVSEFFMKVVKDTVQYREQNNVNRKDFMHLLIQLKNNVIIHEDAEGNLKAAEDLEVGKSLTIEELAAQAFVFFIAGFETSSTTLTFCFFELATNPDVQAKLRQEISNVLEKHGGKITYNALMEMTYMDKCIQETLRKYPPVPMLNRLCTEDYRIPDSDLVVEKGTTVFIPIIGIQHDPEYYPNPEEFDPERFSPENKAERHAFTWLPFGEGPRACIGLRFGMMQTKVALAVLLQHYNFSLDPKTKVPIVLDLKSFILSPEGGVWLQVKKIVK